MKKETKRQHFVPRTFLKHFCNADERLTGIKKNEFNPISVGLNQVCLQNHLYTIDFANSKEEDRQLLEDFYNEYFETNYNEIFQILTTDNQVKISKALKEKIIETVISMYFRVAKWLNVAKANQKTALEKLIEVSKKLNNPIVQLGDGNTLDISGKSVDDLLKEFEPDRKFGFILKQLKGITEFSRNRLNDNISINKTYGDHEFLTSDNPIVLNTGEQALIEEIDPYCHIMLNISPNHCLTIMPPTGKENFIINRINLKENSSFMYTSINNDHQARNCERFVLGTETGINLHIKNQATYNSKEAINEILRKVDIEMKETIIDHYSRVSKK